MELEFTDLQREKIFKKWKNHLRSYIPYGYSGLVRSNALLAMNGLVTAKKYEEFITNLKDEIKKKLSWRPKKDFRLL